MENGVWNEAPRCGEVPEALGTMSGGAVRTSGAVMHTEFVVVVLAVSVPGAGTSFLMTLRLQRKEAPGTLLHVSAVPSVGAVGVETPSGV